MSAPSPNQSEGSTSSASARFSGLSAPGSAGSFAATGVVVDSMLGGGAVVDPSFGASVVVAGSSVAVEDSSVSLEQAVARQISPVAQRRRDSRTGRAITDTPYHRLRQKSFEREASVLVRGGLRRPRPDPTVFETVQRCGEEGGASALAVAPRDPPVTEIE